MAGLHFVDLGWGKRGEEAAGVVVVECDGDFDLVEWRREGGVGGVGGWGC